MSFLFGGRRTASNRKIIDRLNEDIVTAVRHPVFYQAGGVPDTFNGRFELLVLHTWLVVRRLRALEGAGPSAAQDLIDTVFRYLDPALRELGVGDMGVPKRMKKLAEALLGRSIAYDAGLQDADVSALPAALARNVYGDLRPAEDLAAYVRTAAASLDRLGLDEILGADLRLPDPAAFMAQKAA